MNDGRHECESRTMLRRIAGTGTLHPTRPEVAGVFEARGARVPWRIWREGDSWRVRVRCSDAPGEPWLSTRHAALPAAQNRLLRLVAWSLDRQARLAHGTRAR